MVLETVCNNILDRNLICTKSAVIREILRSYPDCFWKGNKKAKNIELFYKNDQNRTTKLNLGTLFMGQMVQGGQKIPNKKCPPDTPSPPRVDISISPVTNRVKQEDPPHSPPST